METTKQRQSSINPAEITCSYCKMWMDYGSDADNAKLDKIQSFPDWNAKECHRLLKLLYLGEVSIKQFKKMFTDAGMDYNFLEHCCGCAGCYESESHRCPDFSVKDKPDCKISDLVVSCCICGITNREGSKEMSGIMTSDGDGFWFCPKHFDHPKMREADEDEEGIGSTDEFYNKVVKVLRKEYRIERKEMKRILDSRDDNILQEHIGK